MAERVWVVTSLELGWDCVIDVFRKEKYPTEEDVRKYYIGEGWQLVDDLIIHDEVIHG